MLWRVGEPVSYSCVKQIIRPHISKLGVQASKFKTPHMGEYNKVKFNPVFFLNMRDGSKVTIRSLSFMTLYFVVCYICMCTYP
jgi:hypothetical protein